MKKIINSTFIKISLALILVITLSSCDEGGDPDPGSTSTEKMAGDWYVHFLVDGEDIYGLGYTVLSTYNTSANDGNEMWINDNLNTWVYKVKVPVDLNNKTFSGTDLESSIDDDDDSETPNYDVSVNITNGKIFNDGAITTGGNVSDSIYFEAEFADDPGTIYQISGYKRTGFLEDEH